MQPLVINRRDRHRVDAVCVPVEIALIAMRCTVSAGKDVDGAFPIPPIGNAVDHRLLNEIARAFHGLSVVRRAPRTGVNRDVLEAVVEGRGLVDVRYGPGKDTHSRYFGIVGEPDTARIVLGSSNLARTAGAVVVVVELRCRKLFVIVEVV
jgi:hypothetical protein